MNIPKNYRKIIRKLMIIRIEILSIIQFQQMLNKYGKFLPNTFTIAGENQLARPKQV